MAWYPSFFAPKADPPEVESVSEELDIRAAHVRFTPIFTQSYNGEKTPGEIGPVKRFILDYRALRARSWQSYLESEITQDVINKFVLWIIGSGLKLQSEPVESVISSSFPIAGIKDMSKSLEARFRLYSGSKSSSYSSMQSLHNIAFEAKKNALIGGDVLVVNRLINGEIKTEIIDGEHVSTPILDTKTLSAARDRGNEIINGIEQDPTGKHIAYYVRKTWKEFERIEAVGKQSGRLISYMVYGLRYRINNNRGIPLIAAVLESLKKLDRYKEATVGSAEERQKIPFTIEHDEISTGENIFVKKIAASKNVGGGANVVDPGEIAAAQIAKTYQKEVYNLPRGARLVSLDTRNELTFKDFYTTNINLICAAIGIPPEVALSKYDSNFSASRAALKDWEHTILVNRKKFSEQFYQPFYNLWMELEIMKGNVSSNGYLNAVESGDSILIEAYRNARWTGPNVPHIDPLKEVAAERAKLGPDGEKIPLTTAEEATEALNGGDFEANQKRFAEEKKIAGIKDEDTNGGENNGPKD